MKSIVVVGDNSAPFGHHIGWSQSRRGGIDCCSEKDSEGDGPSI